MVTGNTGKQNKGMVTGDTRKQNTRNGKRVFQILEARTFDFKSMYVSR